MELKFGPKLTAPAESALRGAPFSNSHKAPVWQLALRTPTILQSSLFALN